MNFILIGAIRIIGAGILLFSSLLYESGRDAVGCFGEDEKSQRSCSDQDQSSPGRVVCRSVDKPTGESTIATEKEVADSGNRMDRC